MDNAPLLILAAGGTGGHMFPAQAVAETMLLRGWRVVLSTDIRGSHYSEASRMRLKLRLYRVELLRARG